MFATFDILAWVLVIAGMDDIRGSRQVVSALQPGTLTPPSEHCHIVASTDLSINHLSKRRTQKGHQIKSRTTFLLLCWPCCVLKIQPFLFFGVFCKSFTPSLVNGLKHLFPNSVPWLFHFGGKLSRMRSEKWAKWAAGRSCLKRPCCSENGHGHNWTAGSTTQHWKCLAPTMWCHSSKIYLFTADTAFVLFSSKSWELIDPELQAWPHLNCPRL